MWVTCFNIGAKLTGILSLCLLSSMVLERSTCNECPWFTSCLHNINTFPKLFSYAYRNVSIFSILVFYFSSHIISYMKMACLPDSSCLKSGRNSHCFVEVFGENSSSQSVCGVVCPLNYFIHSFEFHNLLYRPKYLLAQNVKCSICNGKMKEKFNEHLLRKSGKAFKSGLLLNISSYRQGKILLEKYIKEWKAAAHIQNLWILAEK